ncbi:MAG: iron-sulfur cluster assembly accessory protein [Polyangiaceae bacterium]
MSTEKVSPMQTEPVSNSRPTSGDAPKADSSEKKLSFKLTTMAARKLWENLRKRDTPESALRVGVRGGGCSGFTYVLEFDDGEPRSRDLVFTFPVELSPEELAAEKAKGTKNPEEVRVFCDKKSILYLNGSTLEWQKTLMYQGFRYANPQETSSCGCNESFAV